MYLGDSENIKLHKNNWKSLKGYLKVKGSLTDLFYLSNQFFVQNYSLLRGFRQLEIIHIHYFSDQIEKSIALSKNIFISNTCVLSYHNVCLRHLKLPILCSLNRNFYVDKNIANLSLPVTAHKWSNCTDC